MKPPCGPVWPPRDLMLYLRYNKKNKSYEKFKKTKSRS